MKAKAQLLNDMTSYVYKVGIRKLVHFRNKFFSLFLFCLSVE
jgi:hypothetical protein